MLKSVMNVLMVPVLGFALLIAVSHADVIPGGLGEGPVAPDSSWCPRIEPGGVWFGQCGPNLCHNAHNQPTCGQNINGTDCTCQ